MQSATSTGPRGAEDFNALFVKLAEEYDFGSSGPVFLREGSDQLKARVDHLGQKIIETMRDTVPSIEGRKVTFTLNETVKAPQRLAKFAVDALKLQYEFHIRLTGAEAPSSDPIPLLFKDALAEVNDKMGNLHDYKISVRTDMDNPHYSLRPTYIPLQDLGKDFWEDRGVNKVTDVEIMTSEPNVKLFGHSHVLKLRCPNYDWSGKGTVVDKTLEIPMLDFRPEIVECVLKVLYLGSYQPVPFLTLNQISQLDKVCEIWKCENVKPWIDDQLKVWLAKGTMSDADFHLLFSMGLQRRREFALCHCFDYIQKDETKIPLLFAQVTAENFAHVSALVAKGGFAKLQGPLLRHAGTLLSGKKA